MKQTRTQDIMTHTKPEPTLGNGAVAQPVRRGRAFGAGLLPKAGVLALLLGLPLGASLLTAGEPPHQPKYRFTELALPGPGYGIGINDAGVVTGGYIDPVSGNLYAYVYDHGRLTTGIAAPGATITAFGPANNRGVEIGNYGDETDQQAAFYNIRTGTITPLPEIPGMPFNFAGGINDFGHADGVAYPGGDFYTGGDGLGVDWIWDGRDYSFFTVPGAAQGAVPVGINDWDQISGYYVDSSGTPHGFLKDGSKYVTLDVPGAVYTLAAGLNNFGVVAGQYVDASGGHHGLLWSHGQFTTVDADIPGSLGTALNDVNDRGDVVGDIHDSNNVRHVVIGVRVDGDEDQEDGE